VLSAGRVRAARLRVSTGAANCRASSRRPSISSARPGRMPRLWRAALGPLSGCPRARAAARWSPAPGTRAALRACVHR
jgi:hypothetical protein